MRLVKKSGLTFKAVGIRLSDLPTRLYILPDHKDMALKEIQQGLSQELNESIKRHDHFKVKSTMVEFMQETLDHPTVTSLEGVEGIINTVLKEYLDHPQILQNMASISLKDYSTAVHVTNVMALGLCFSVRMGFSYIQSKNMGLAAMLHDVGKLAIPTQILRSSRCLTDLEFERMKRHTVSGHYILRRCKFASSAIAATALQHHEKQDGSGYPYGRTDMPTISRIVSILDAYEALTSDSRPYRTALEPFDALQLIADEVRAGKYDSELFRNFVESLSPKTSYV